MIKESLIVISVTEDTSMWFISSIFSICLNKNKSSYVWDKKCATSMCGHYVSKTELGYGGTVLHLEKIE